jgi:uncharacterized protein (DUF2235 family)
MTVTKKKLAVFFDGTWNMADQKSKDGRPCPTNVVKLFEATNEEDREGSPQIIHYIQGVGTGPFDRILGGGFGLGISDNIKEGYKFLVSNYSPGDEIYIFGFSRGAFSARSLAGLIYNLGILKRNKLYLVNEVYRRYRDRSKEWHPTKGSKAVEFRKRFTWGNEAIHFLGVFDTVGSLGLPFGVILRWLVDKIFKCSFHDTKLSRIIENAFHAVSIDERRYPFQPTLMINDDNRLKEPDHFEQKWFSGVHSDVGGGYEETGLSCIALKWMAQKADEKGLAMDFRHFEEVVCKAEDQGILEKIHDSQTLFYRLSSALFVKLPGTMGMLPDMYKESLSHLQWNGDYIRPIGNPGNAAQVIGGTDTAAMIREYRGDLHSSVFYKIKNEEDYQPENVVGKTESPK